MSDLYGFAQPVAVSQFRDRTAKHAKMAGVTYSTFICKQCGLSKSVTGSRFITPKHPKDGRLCADCLPASVATPPVAPKTPAKASAPAKPAKPPKAQQMTDAQVLECREAHEFDGARIEVLARKYGTTLDYMRKLLEYVVRGKLIPARHRAARN